MSDALFLVALGGVLGILLAIAQLYFWWRKPCTWGSDCLYGGTVLFFHNHRIEAGPRGQRYYTHTRCLEANGE